MKRKLLTVLLAVVMVFGVFGLTACGGSNADADYNYYGIKYELEDEVKIQAVTYQGVYKMFTTKGRFLMYVDSETGANTKANFQAINKLANDWNVTIYHFNPDLTGGYAKTAKTANANVLKAVEADANIIYTIQQNLLKISNTKLDAWVDGTLAGIVGAESTANAKGELTYGGKVAKFATPDKGAEAIAAVCQQRVDSYVAQQPSFGTYTDEKGDKPLIPEAYLTDCINTINCFADARLHMYDEKGDLTAEKEDVFVTVANYAMFAHLMDNNEGYFPVFFGGTWCGNTQAIAKATNDLAKDYGIEKIYFFDPNLTDGTMGDAVKSTTTWTTEQYNADVFAANEALINAKEAAKKAVAADKAAAKAAVDAAKAAVEAAKALDPADAAAVKAAEEVLKDANADLALFVAVEDAQKAFDNATVHGGYVTTYTVAENSDRTLYGPNTRDSDKNSAWAYAYASFLDNYLDTYTSEWNVGVKLNIGGKDYTKMCVPNIMMFNGEGEGAAKLVALAEAEYRWEAVSVEGNPSQIAWANAVKNVFDANPYAKYAPVLVAEQAAPEASAPAASAPAAGGDAGGC